MMAATNTKIETIRALIAAGADPNKQDFSGCDAIGWATGKPSSLRVLQTVQTREADFIIATAIAVAWQSRARQAE